MDEEDKWFSEWGIIILKTIVKRILVSVDIGMFLSPENFSSVRIS